MSHPMSKSQFVSVAEALNTGFTQEHADSCLRSAMHGEFADELFVQAAKIHDMHFKQATVLDIKDIIVESQYGSQIHRSGGNPKQDEITEAIQNRGWNVRCRPICVLYKNGKYYMLDGRTRLNSCNGLNFHNVIVFVFTTTSEKPSRTFGNWLNQLGYPEGRNTIADIKVNMTHLMKNNELEFFEEYLEDIQGISENSAKAERLRKTLAKAVNAFCETQYNYHLTPKAHSEIMKLLYEEDDTYGTVLTFADANGKASTSNGKEYIVKEIRSIEGEEIEVNEQGDLTIEKNGKSILIEVVPSDYEMTFKRCVKDYQSWKEYDEIYLVMVPGSLKVSSPAADWKEKFLKLPEEFKQWRNSATDMLTGGAINHAISNIRLYGMLPACESLTNYPLDQIAKFPKESKDNVWHLKGVA